MESPLAQVRFWLVLTGMLKQKNARFKHLSTVKSIVISFITINTMVDSLINIFFTQIPLLDKIEGGLYLIACVPVTAHQMKVLFNREKFEKFFETIELLYAEGVKGESRGFLEERVRLSKKINYLTILLMESFIPSAFAVAFIVTFGTEQPVAPFKIWTPIKAEENYFLACLYQLVVILVPVQLMVTSHVVIVTVSIIVAAQFKILQNQLRLRTPGSAKSNISTYIFHRKLIRLVRDMNELYRASLFVEIITASVTCCITGYAIKIGGSSDPRTMTLVINFATCLILPALVCICGNLITSEAAKVHECAYQNLWYDEPPSERQNLLILSTMATKGVNIHFRHVMRFDLERYSLVLQGAYSYSTMLRMMDY